MDEFGIIFLLGLNFQSPPWTKGLSSDCSWILKAFTLLGLS
jgi:hypothetical protein